MTLAPFPTILVKQLDHAKDIPLPSYATIGATGMDLLAAVIEPITILSQERMLVPTGLQIALPKNYELQIRPRSGLALNHGILVPNSPGTIDEDYRGEIQVILLNMGKDAFIIERGMRIAQAVISPVTRAIWKEIDTLEKTERSYNGFGSTGLF